MRRRLALAAEAALASFISHVEAESGLWPDDLRALNAALAILRKYPRHDRPVACCSTPTPTPTPDEGSAMTAELEAKLANARGSRNDLAEQLDLAVLRVIDLQAALGRASAALDAVQTRANYESEALNDYYRRGWNNAMGQIRTILAVSGVAGNPEEAGEK